MCSRIEAPKARNVFANRSAEGAKCVRESKRRGAKYDSQGQARKRVAPGTDHQEFVRALKERNNLLRPFRPQPQWGNLDQGRRASRLPLAFIFRAFGASAQKWMGR